MDALSESRRTSADSLQSASTSHPRGSNPTDVPEDSTFQIGDDDDEDTDDDRRPTPLESSPARTPSQGSSVSSSIDEAVPTQMRGMSEKARGKMPGQFHSSSRPTMLMYSSWLSHFFPPQQYHQSLQLHGSHSINKRALHSLVHLDRDLAADLAVAYNS